METISGMDGDEGHGLPSETKQFNKMSAKDILEKHAYLRINPNDIKVDSKPHARGGQADVTAAILKRTILGQGTRVAVKKLRYDGETDNDKFSKSFAGEVDILARLSHCNIVKLLGFLEDLETGHACMVFTWEENGNVQEFLAARECHIPERISLIKDVTDGLEYLHTRQPPICHGDLKSLNILVNSSFRAIITDFGSARARRGKPERQVASEPEPKTDQHALSTQINVSVTGNQLTLTGPCWSVRWAAPEVVLGEDPDLPSDVWAVGWVVWEIITDKVPFHELCNEVAVTMAVIEQKNPSDVGNDAQMLQIVGLCSLVKDCLAYDPASRPTANKCCTSVKWMPSVVPTDTTQSGVKTRPAALLLNMGYMRYSQNDHDAAAALFKEALESAFSAHDTLSAADAQNWLGEVYLAQHRYHDAELSFSQARDIYTGLGLESGRMRALDGLGGVYHARCLLKKAEESFTEAEGICIRIGDDVGRASVLNGIGAVCLTQCRYPEAETCYAQALDIYKSAGNELGQANSLSGLGSVYHALCRYEAAERWFIEAEGICTRVGDDAGRANVLNGIAAVHLATCEYSRAEECYTQALEIYDRVGNYLGRANSLNGLGSVYHVQSQYTEAKASLLEAEHICDGIGNDAGRANALTRIAAVHLMEGKPHEAEQCYTQARDICDRLGDDLGRANALSGLGSLDHVNGRYEEAIERFAEAKNIYGRIRNRAGEANVSNRIGATFFMQEDLSEADGFFDSAGRIYDRIGDHLGKANSLIGVGQVRRAERDYEGAAASFHAARALHKRISNKQGRVNLLTEYAELFCALKQYDAAERVLVKAKDLCSQVGHKRGEAHTLIALGCVKDAQGYSFDGRDDCLQGLMILVELDGKGSPASEMRDRVSQNFRSVYSEVQSFFETDWYAQHHNYLRSIYTPL